jgi:hypothetical protein
VQLTCDGGHARLDARDVEAMPGPGALEIA